MTQTIEEFYGPVVSTYTDGQAVDDGILVAVSDRDRVSRPLFDFLAEKLDDTPPAGWPVDLMGYATARSKAKTLDEVGLRRAVAASRGLIEQNRRAATSVYEENIGGGIWAGFVQLGQQGDREIITGFDETDGPGGDRKVWLMPNECGGLTLMFPEDN